MDQAEAAANRQKETEARRRREARERRETQAQTEARDAQLRQTWAALPETRQAEIREQILRDQPLCRRFPALLEAACLMRLAEFESSECQ